MYKIEYEKSIKKDLRKLDKSKIIYIKKEIEKIAIIRKECYNNCNGDEKRK